jgi:hypothetical protein
MINICAYRGRRTFTDEDRRPMSLMIELLASAHEADLQRESHERRMKDAVTACRRRFFDFLKPERPCDPQPC